MPAPYAGNQTNFPDAVDLPDGSDPPSSTVFDTAYEGVIDRTSYLRGAADANACTNWRAVKNVNPGIFSGGGTLIYCAAWDPKFERWLLANTYIASAVNNIQINASDNGEDWWPLSPLPSNTTWVPIAMAVEPTTGAIGMVRWDLGTNWGITLQLQGVASAEVNLATIQPPAFEPGQGVMVYFYSNVNASTKTWMFIGASGYIESTPWTGMGAGASAPGYAWVNLAPGLPTNWASSSSNEVFQWLAAIDESYPAAGDCNSIVFAQCGTRPGTDKSYLLHWNQSAPTTFADVTPSFLSSGAYQIRGLAWSPIDQLWGMVVVNGDANGHGANPASSFFVTSPDLVTWTTVFTFVDFIAGGLACVGNIWTIIGSYTLLTWAPSNRMLWSNNVSLGTSQTWNESNYSDADNSYASSIWELAVDGGYPQRLLMGNGHQFLTAYLFGATAPSFIGNAATSAQSTTGIG